MAFAIYFQRISCKKGWLLSLHCFNSIGVLKASKNRRQFIDSLYASLLFIDHHLRYDLRNHRQKTNKSFLLLPVAPTEFNAINFDYSSLKNFKRSVCSFPASSMQREIRSLWLRQKWMKWTRYPLPPARCTRFTNSESFVNPFDVMMFQKIRTMNMGKLVNHQQ